MVSSAILWKTSGEVVVMFCSFFFFQKRLTLPSEVCEAPSAVHGWAARFAWEWRHLSGELPAQRRADGERHPRTARRRNDDLILRSDSANVPLKQLLCCFMSHSKRKQNSTKFDNHFKLCRLYWHGGCLQNYFKMATVSIAVFFFMTLISWTHCLYFHMRYSLFYSRIQIMLHYTTYLICVLAMVSYKFIFEACNPENLGWIYLKLKTEMAIS